MESTADIHRQNLRKWRAALQTGAAAAVAELYADSATFLPTLVAELKRGRAGAAEYFAAFLKQHPDLKVVDECVQWIGDDAYIHSGLYDFTFDGGDDAHAKHIKHVKHAKRDRVGARFTFVWRREHGEWKIQHHHSSLRPVK